MNDQQIYQHLARKPDSRAQDIADALDVDLREASDALRSLVDVGDVVRYAGIARNNVPTQLYNLSEAFKKTKDGAALLAAAALTPDAAPAKSEPQVPVFAQATSLPPQQTIKTTKVDLAIAHVQKGPATDDELRTVMGIEKPAAPAAYLVSAIKSGRIHKGEKGWTKGCATGGAVYNPPISTRKDEQKARFGPTAQPEEPAPAPPATDPAPADPIKSTVVRDVFVSARGAALDAAVSAITAAPDVGIFRFGLWSDGVLELQRDGKTVEVLSTKEREKLTRFLDRASSLMLATT